MKKRIFAIAILMLTMAPGALAQQTWNQTAFTNQATNGRSTIFRNINQSSHWLTYCAGSQTTGGTIEIDASADGVNWITISNLGVLGANGCGSVQGGGYYPNISAKIAGLTGAAPTVTATYSASTGAIATPSNAGYSTTDQPVTMVPITAVFTSTGLKSTASQLSTFTSNVLYGATVFNPNSGTVYVAFSGSSTPFVGGGSGVFMIPVAAGQALPVSLPPQGISFGGTGLYVGCSTSPTSAADPSTACVVSSFWKQVPIGIVPN